MIEPSNILKQFLSYSFAEVDKIKQDFMSKGYQIKNKYKLCGKTRIS
jgi:hypothetical protein